MKRIRTHAHTGSRLHGLLLTFTMAFVVIAGLLAMHTLTTTASPHAHGAGAAVTNSAMDMDAPATADHPATAGHGVDTCDGDCGSGGASDHSMLLMMCVLALLAVAIILVGPGVVAQTGAAPGALIGLLTRARALAWPPPPSLHVLSISRT